ncbi:GMP synthase [glutamine-hydrolyzing] [Nitrosomonas stercoris]|uniref:GMP synthase [glutamine-hydrolyzing] n=1 Tax=Nitrosomonas stercoris TaxID=1444684 RepID=A0A4Y1YPQ0_9PROT|nr:GMP synthase [glutamine-hydrolyzing] [Nitrosomonas stercoris]
MHSAILILDFGSQYSRLIARRIRAASVYCEIHPFDIGTQFIREFSPIGIILSGGPESIFMDASETPRAPQIVFELGVPVLGICYGMQVMTVQLGGEIETAPAREFGYAELFTSSSRLLQDIKDRISSDGKPALDVWMSHGDQVSKLPPGFTAIASNAATPFAGIADETRQFYGLQFHPEVSHTLQGKVILERFAHDICGASYDWNMQNYVEEAVGRIRARVGTDKVILGLSGGVDSSVAAALIHRAIGDQLVCVFVDNGLLRHHEARQTMETFSRNLSVNVIHVDAGRQFLRQLEGITDPEQKRHAIGREFVEIFQQEAAKIEGVKWLAQGTIYPDVIESAGDHLKKSGLIKSHHNVGGLPETLRLKLLEPLRELFKDEVRQLGLALGLPRDLVFRHPFPGPGLGVRILGEVKYEYTELLRQADAIFIEELINAGWYEKTSQAFAVFLPIKSVGIIDNSRSYEYVIALRAVQTEDFMTAHWAELPYTLLARISNRIINEIRGINRVVYDVSGKPPATIEWE